MAQNDSLENQNNETTSPHKPVSNFDINHFFADNRKMIMYVGGGLVALIILFFGYKKFISEPDEIEAETKIFYAEQYFNADSLNLAIKGDGQHMGLQELVDNYGSTTAGKRASYLLGIALYRQGKYDEAIDHLENYDLNDLILQPEALGMIGDCYIEKGENEKAVSYFVKAAEVSKNNFTSPRFYKKAGLVYESLKEYEKAKGYYEKVQKEFPESEAAKQDIEQLIARAEAMMENEK
jgi:TolA-binding protein